MRLRCFLFANLHALTLTGCASLEGLRALIQPPRFEQAPDRPSEIRLSPIQSGPAAGAATVRIWTNVTNPNPFGLTLSTVQATLLLDEVEGGGRRFSSGLAAAAAADDTLR